VGGREVCDPALISHAYNPIQSLQARSAEARRGPGLLLRAHQLARMGAEGACEVCTGSEGKALHTRGSHPCSTRWLAMITCWLCDSRKTQIPETQQMEWRA
jgi:hypothetical protein